jgi:hypothetical protein
MESTRGRRRKGFALLAAMAFLLVAASFHSGADNDLAGLGSGVRLALPASLPAPDTCAACNLDGLLTARLSLTTPVALPSAAEILVTAIPPSPFVAPRASVDSRPPPAA